MSKTPNYDAKVKAILDATHPGERTCALTGEKWDLDDREIGFLKKYKTPPHPWSPLTRMKQLVGFFEMYQFWYRDHPETGKPFLASVHPLTGIPALPDEEWFAKDFESIHQDVDIQKSFFEQMRALQLRVPLPATRTMVKGEGSIAMASLGDIHSFFVLACRSKSSLYCSDAVDIERSVEISAGDRITDSYHVIMSHRIHNGAFLQGCYDCMDSMFLFDCRDCSDCFGATNKRRRKFLWMNEQLSEAEYRKRRKATDLRCRSSLAKAQSDFAQLMRKQAVWPENFNERCTNVLGEYVVNAVDCKYLYAGMDGPFARLHQINYLAGDCRDSAFVAGLYTGSDCFMSTILVQCSNCMHSYGLKGCQNLEYCMGCHDCEDCFGCIGLRKKRFHIFNKPYEESAYWEEVDRIKCAMLERGEYGSFFPAKMYLGYWPDNGLMLYDALDQADLFDPNHFGPEEGNAVRKVSSARTRTTAEVPDCIDDMTDEEWANVPLFDTTFGRNYSFLKQELDFYRRHGLPAPTTHFVKRVYDLYWEANLSLFLHGACGQCGTSIVFGKNVIYPDKRVLCKPCYLEYLEKNG